MNLPFTITYKLTDADCNRIDQALVSHRITIDDERFSRLCNSVERALEYYLLFRDEKADSRAEALAQIKTLHGKLTGLSSTVSRILADSSLYTLAQRRLEATGETYRALLEALDKQLSHGEDLLSDEDCERLCNEGPQSYPFGLALSLLAESCELALKNEPPALYSDNGTVVSANVAKTGRPTNHAKEALVGQLAMAFEAATKRKATDTESGPFDDFVSECLAVIEPNRPTGTTHRKLIRKALQYVPKRRRKN